VGGVLRISVIIPTHNRASLLRSAVESVTNQTYPVHEILIVDDGSTDETKQVVQELVRSAKRSCTSIHYFRQEQHGVAAARNTGIKAVTGDWVAFLDSDDRWLPEKLAWQVQALKRFAATSTACVTDATYVNNSMLKKTAFEQADTVCTDLIGLFPNLPERVAYGFHGLYLQALLMTLQTVTEIGEFDTSRRLGEDSDFLFRLASNTVMCYVNIPLIEIDRTPNRAVGLIELSRNEKFRLELNQRLYEKWLNSQAGQTPKIRKRIRRRLQEVHGAWSSWYLIDNQYVQARNALRIALRYKLTLKDSVKWFLVGLMPSLARTMVIKKRAMSTEEVLF